MTSPLLLLTSILAAGDNPISHVVDYVRWKGAGIAITNHMIIMSVVALLMLLIFVPMSKRYRSGELVPTGTRNLFEAILLYVREDVARPVLAEHTDRFAPFLWTLFFFILFNNLLGLLPLDVATSFLMGRDATGHWRHGIGGTPTANIYVTGALALISFVVIQVSGIRANGFVNYAKHFLAGAPPYMAPILIPVEIVGMIVKPVALMIRLFANMTAGHILLAVLIGFVTAGYRWGKASGMGGGTGALLIGIPSVLGSVAIMCLEVFVAFLQAYLFTFLTSLFIGQLVVHEHDEHHEDEHAHDAGSHEPSLDSGDLTDHGLPAPAKQAGTHMAG